MNMSRASLVAALKLALNDAKSFFIAAADADFIRHLDNAAADLARIAPEYTLGSVTLEGCESLYDVPADLVRVERLLWGDDKRALNPWDANFPGKLPRISVVRVDGVRKLQFTPAPTYQQVAALGATAKFRYVANYVIGEAAADTTVPEYRAGLLLLRAQAEAMLELANRGVAKPVQLRDGHSGQPRNAHPAMLYEQLMRECERQAAA